MLLPGDNFTIEQLLYGLMLPSGNDAAYALASYLGSFLAQKSEEVNDLITLNDADCEEIDY